jgi:hypothetical protein
MNALRNLAETYFSGDQERALNYVKWVSETYGPEQIIQAVPPGPIYGKAGDILKENSDQ